MGEMGREFDGGYAEYALLPNELLIPFESTLSWEVLGALPETYLTAEGSLTAMDLDVVKSGVLLVRGGSSSVGMAALSVAKDWDLTTIATTRNRAKADALRAEGADEGDRSGRHPGPGTGTGSGPTRLRARSDRRTLRARLAEARC